MSSLLPCPFCGSEEISSIVRGGSWISYACQVCEAEGPRVEANPEKRDSWLKSDEVWNKREAGRRP